MNQATDAEFMAQAIDVCRRGVGAGQSPFGACIVRDGQVVASEHNRVWDQTDITAHAEVVAIRAACRALNSIDLSGCVIYSTTEPCPMCFGAIHWARIGRIVYGASIADAASFGFHELSISNEQMKRLGETGVELVGGCMKDASIDVFRTWSSAPEHRAY